MTTSKPTDGSESWAIVDENGKEYAAPLGEPITAPEPGFYTIRWPLVPSSQLPLVMVLPKDPD